MLPSAPHPTSEYSQGALRVSVGAELAAGPARTQTPCPRPPDARLLEIRAIGSPDLSRPGFFMITFKEFESSGLDESTLIVRIRAASPEIDAVTHKASRLPSPQQDVSDYQDRAQSLFCLLSNMALCYSESGVTTWTRKNRTILMRDSVNEFQADLQRLEFERERLH